MAIFEKRHHLRGEWEPVWFLVGDAFFRAEVWSRGGALLEDYQGHLTPGSLFSVSALGRDGGDEAIPAEIKARVVRQEAGGRLAVQFLVIDRRAHDFFARVLGEPLAEPARPVLAARVPPPRARMARTLTPTAGT